MQSSVFSWGIESYYMAGFDASPVAVWSLGIFPSNITDEWPWLTHQKQKLSWPQTGFKFELYSLILTRCWRLLSWLNSAASPQGVSKYTWALSNDVDLSLHEKTSEQDCFLSALVGTLWGHVGNFVIVRLYGVPKNMQGISINYTFREKCRFGANTLHVPYSGAIVTLLFMTLKRWKDLKLHEGKRLCSPVSITVENNRMITTTSHMTGSIIDGEPNEQLWSTCSWPLTAKPSWMDEPWWMSPSHAYTVSCPRLEAWRDPARGSNPHSGRGNIRKPPATLWRLMKSSPQMTG